MAIGNEPDVSADEFPITSDLPIKADLHMRAAEDADSLASEAWERLKAIVRGNRFKPDRAAIWCAVMKNSHHLTIENRSRDHSPGGDDVCSVPAVSDMPNL